MYDGLIERLRTAAGPKYTEGRCFVSNEDLHDAAFLLESLSSRYEKALSDIVKKEKQQGHWETASDGVLSCSVCGENALQRLTISIPRRFVDCKQIASPYCPNCGADMRGKK